MELNQDKLKELLIEAEKNHAEYEKDLGERDENWAKWYAGYMLQRLWDESEPEEEEE